MKVVDAPSEVIHSLYVTSVPHVWPLIQVEVHSFVALASGEGDGNKFVANILAHRDVDEAGLHNVFFQLCPVGIEVQSITAEGDLTFRNPYGYMPVSFLCLHLHVSRGTIMAMINSYASTYLILESHHALSPFRKSRRGSASLRASSVLMYQVCPLIRSAAVPPLRTGHGLRLHSVRDFPGFGVTRSRNILRIGDAATSSHCTPRPLHDIWGSCSRHVRSSILVIGLSAHEQNW